MLTYIYCYITNSYIVLLAVDIRRFIIERLPASQNGFIAERH